MIERVCASICLPALQHNLQVARGYAGSAKLVAMIKANAYGHGLIPVAEALAQADMFGVTDINEAEALRSAGTQKPILILQGIIDPSEVPRIVAGNFHTIIHRLEDLSYLEQYLDRHPPAEPLTFWLKLQSGMGRLGIGPQEYVEIYNKLLAKTWTNKIVMLTHLANSSLPDSTLNDEQLICFDQVHNQLIAVPPATSIQASAGLLSKKYTSNWVRPGIMLYGSSPFDWDDLERRREQLGLQAVMTLQAKLISISEHHAGDNIGYNSQFICPQAMRIGIVSIGYADGYPSCTPNGAPVEVCGIRTVTTGRVSMDMLAIDLSAIPQAQLGDAVTLWGEGISLDEVAAHTGILSYNLTCSIKPRVALRYV